MMAVLVRLFSFTSHACDIGWHRQMQGKQGKNGTRVVLQVAKAEERKEREREREKG